MYYWGADVSPRKKLTFYSKVNPFLSMLSHVTQMMLCCGGTQGTTPCQSGRFGFQKRVLSIVVYYLKNVDN